MKTRISVQERLKDLRVERGLNLEELAQETGISKSALGSYENDNDEYKEINHGSLLKLADFYQVSVDYLLGLTNNRKYENTPIEELHLSDEVVELLKSERLSKSLGKSQGSLVKLFFTTCNGIGNLTDSQSFSASCTAILSKYLCPPM